MLRAKSVLLGLAAAVVLGATMSGPALSQTVGISWANFQEERWKTDKAALEDQLSSHGIRVIDADAQSSLEKQNADIENLITRGIDFLIVVAADTEAVIPAVRAAQDEGIPVLGYDRLIELAGVFYTTFDNIEVGRIQVGMEGIPVSGQDGDFAALNRVARGVQTVSVWKDARALGRVTADAIAEILDEGGSMASVNNAITFANGPGKIPVPAILLAPVPVQFDNLDVVIDAGWVSRDVVCQGVSGNVPPACR